MVPVLERNIKRCQNLYRMPYGSYIRVPIAMLLFFRSPFAGECEYSEMICPMKICAGKVLFSAIRSGLLMCMRENTYLMFAEELDIVFSFGCQVIADFVMSLYVLKLLRSMKHVLISFHLYRIFHSGKMYTIRRSYKKIFQGVTFIYNLTPSPPTSYTDDLCKQFGPSSGSKLLAILMIFLKKSFVNLILKHINSRQNCCNITQYAKT